MSYGRAYADLCALIKCNLATLSALQNGVLGCILHTLQKFHEVSTPSPSVFASTLLLARRFHNICLYYFKVEFSQRDQALHTFIIRVPHVFIAS